MGSTQPQPRAAIETAGVLPVLNAEPGVGVGLYTIGAEIVWANDALVRMFFGESALARDCIGRTLWDLMPAAAVRERFAAAMRAMVSGRPMLIRATWGDRRMETWLHGIDADPGQSGDSPGRADFLAISRRLDAPAEPSQRAEGPGEFTAEPAEAPESATPRELAVLALVGQGVAHDQIARALGCSPGEIDVLRAGALARLRLRPREEQAEIAAHAGLTLDDRAI